jgi:hypothetical protein
MPLGASYIMDKKTLFRVTLIIERLFITSPDHAK